MSSSSVLVSSRPPDPNQDLPTLEAPREKIMESTSAILAAQEPITIPDGGLRAWLSVLGGWTILFVTFGYSNSFGVYQSLYAKEGASSQSGISWIGSLQLCLMFGLGLISGKLFDEGYFHQIIFAGSVLYIFSLFMLSLADPSKYYQLILAQGVGAGIGAGLLLVPALSVQSHFWKKRRAFAMGMVVMGTSMGGLIYPIMLNQLIFKTSLGYAWGVRASAFLTLGLLVIANCVMSTRLPSGKDRPAAPKPSLKSVLTDPPYMMANAGTFLMFLGLYFPFFYLQVFAEFHGISANVSFYSIAILNAGSAVGRCIPNFIADHVGLFNVIVPTSFICTALLWAMFGATTEGAMVVFALLYGFFAGGFISLLTPTMAALAKNVDEVGLRLGVGYFLTSFAMLIGNPISGALLNPGQHWYRPIVFSGVVMFVGSCILIIPRQMMVKRRGSQYV